MCFLLIFFFFFRWCSCPCVAFSLRHFFLLRPGQLTSSLTHSPPLPSRAAILHVLENQVYMTGSLPTPTCSDTVKDGNYAATLSVESALVYGPLAEEEMARWLILNGPLSVALDAMGMDYYSGGIDMGEVLYGVHVPQYDRMMNGFFFFIEINLFFGLEKGKKIPPLPFLVLLLCIKDVYSSIIVHP